MNTIVGMVASLEVGRMGPNDPEETAALVKRAAAGEHEAWNALVRRFNGLIWAIIRQHRLSQEDAQDATQVVWLRLLESLGSVREPSRVGAWLATTTRYECLRLIRLRRRVVAATDSLLESQIDPAPSPEKIVTERDHRRAVFAVVRKLGSRCRQLLELSAFKLRYHEIAELLDMPVGSIGPTRNRCLDQLRRLLRTAGINPDVLDS
jgi:RNA polymerase sigma factor (sigma-70 family)